MEKTNINNNLQEEARKTSIKLLESIKSAIQAYNKLNPNDNIVLNFESQYHDVNDVFVCTYYNNECGNKLIGLFNRFTVQKRLYDLIFGDEIRDYIIYKGNKSEYVGIRSLYYNEYQSIGASIKDINNNSYTANCAIENELGFDDLRLKMYNEGLIGPYEFGKATNAEMLEVLKYASEYFGLTDAKQKIK